MAELTAGKQEASERSPVEGALEESEARFRLFSQVSREGVVVHDGQTILDCNLALARMFGFERAEDMIGRSASELATPESIALLAEKMRQSSDEPYEVVGRRVDGSTFPIEAVGRSMRWQGRDVRVGIVRDLSFRKQREAELRAREEHLDAMFHQASAGITETDLSGRFLRANDRYCQIVGRSREELLKTRMQDITDPEDLPGNLVLFQRMVQTGEPFEVEKRYIHPAGHRVWVNNSVTLVRDHDGGPTSIVAVTVDVTARRRAEEALRESEARHRALFDQAGAGVAHLDLDGRWIIVNQKLCDILGYTAEELTDLSFHVVTHPEDLAGDLPLVRALDAGEIPSFRREKRYIRKDGTPIWVEINVSLIRDQAGRPAHRVAIIQDIGERKQWEEHQRLLINELNHRVKNTLATVQSIASQSFRQIAREAAPRLQAFDERLFALSRAHDVLTRENWEGADLRDVAAEVLEPYRRQSLDRIHLRGPSARLSPSAALPISMALHELATNASKYGALSTPEGRVLLEWTVGNDAPSQLRLVWRETGGPPVAPPARQGFGTRLIERVLAEELGGGVGLEFAPTGVVCSISVPLQGSCRGPEAEGPEQTSSAPVAP